MKKNIITAVGLISLVVLSYVGIAQLSLTKKEISNEPEPMEIEQEEELQSSGEKKGESMPEMTLPSGLKYTIEKHGTGETTAVPGQVIEVHYTGWLDDNGKPGKKFDSSIDRGTPFKFIVGVGQVIAGWDEALLSMRVGEKRHLIIPPALGYGARGAGNSIPPHATLHFDVELLSIGKR